MRYDTRCLTWLLARVRTISLKHLFTFRLCFVFISLECRLYHKKKHIQISFMNYSSNPKKRYELFLKATQLDVIIEKLNASSQQVSIANAKCKAQQRQHANYVEAQKKAHEKLNQFKSMEPLKVSNCCIFYIAFI